MAKLFIKEYKVLGDDDRTVAQIPQEPGTDQTPLDFTSGEQKSDVFDDETKIVMLEADADCHILFGENPTATTDNEPLKAGVTKYKGVDKNSDLKVSVISA